MRGPARKSVRVSVPVAIFPKATVKHVLTLLALLSTLLAGACSSGGGGVSLDSLNPPPVYEGRGCYDHKGRLERMIPTQAECNVQDWTWKP